MDYKETLNLPKTDFPMKANLAKKELETLEKWGNIDLYGLLVKRGEGRERFILHDGPPYANGNIHSGHALNKILKDIIIKTKSQSGYFAPYVPGWDCHGLPIEHQVDKKLGKSKGSMTPSQKRSECRAYAEKYVAIQKEEFIRLGILGDWENPYLTMSHEYEMGIVRELIKFLASGSLYRDFKPVHWCISCGTALAEAEVEYADHTSPSIFVRFKLKGGDAGKLGLPEDSTYLVIWTTTPWTLPANLAVCLHPDFTYNAVTAGSQTLIMAQDLTEECMKTFGLSDYKIVKTFKGAQLDMMTAKHPFLDKDSQVINGAHVTLEQGTGCVHTAPGHGQDDYNVGLKYGLEVYNPVDPRGKFLPGTPHFEGLNVWKANGPIIAMLKENKSLMAVDEITHSYPHCWRCKKPIIFRATAQWFISMATNDLRKKALETIRGVKWIPKWGEERIFGMVESRPDWCVSRQRVWGVPIIAFYCKKCDEALFDEQTANHVAGLMEKEGVDVWFDKPASELLPSSSECKKCGGKSFSKGRDILDVWFDSGVSHTVVMDRDERLGWPADLYLEGSDQHRGWFHTSLLTSVGARGEAPYKEVLTHGYVLYRSGEKMSKSQGNVIAPQTIIDRYGAEIIRLWVASEDYREDVRLSDEILRRLTEAYRKIRNTVRFMLGATADFDPAQDMVKFEDRLELDRVILIKFHKLIRKITEAFDKYEFHVFYHAIHNFCVVDLSSFYLDIIKDRLYTYPKTSAGRRSAQSTLYDITIGILKLMSPVLSFTAEEAWDYLPGDPDEREKSVHLASFPKPEYADMFETLMSEWERIIVIRGEVSQALEAVRKDKLIGHSLDAKLALSAFEEDRRLLESHSEELPFIFIVSQVALVDDPGDDGLFRSENAPGLTVKVVRAEGEKCDRCWNYSATVGESDEHPLICSRCVSHLGDS
ncbi:Isoleucyl-tRNA synthetase [hydrothermal vent metagenome]|uniref:isoleucine--tRNA ligase n=1 Tax=hydrothermal vent metagenome TaxID=652676 RepID=A0A3B1BDQ2_9ZZZZ